MPTVSFITITDGWPSIDIGKLKHRVTIKQYGFPSPPVYDAAGPVKQWTEFVTTMAAISPISGKDVIRGGQANTQLFLAVAIWYIPGILPEMQLFNETTGTEYVIQSIENVLEMNVVLTLNCLGIAGQAA